MKSFRKDMGITEKQLNELISINVDLEKTSSISSDGKNFLSRIPKEIAEFLELRKGEKIRWFVNTDKKIKLEIVR